ncbi:MAG: hypothetical protein WBO70_02035 [Erysipelotrichaceae bacterium]
MDNNLKIRKCYRVKNDTDKKIKELVGIENNKRELLGMTYKTNETEIIEMALSNYYNKVISNKISDHTVETMEMIVDNTMSQFQKELQDNMIVMYNSLKKDLNVITYFTGMDLLMKKGFTELDEKQYSLMMKDVELAINRIVLKYIEEREMTNE